LKVGVTGMQGWRTEMEDAHIAADMPSLPSHTYLAVFDGYVYLNYDKSYIYIKNII
jgi:hypothetical protein